MIYGVLFFLAVIAVIILSRKVAEKIAGANNKFARNRWLWGFGAVIFLTVGVFLPIAWLVAKGFLIVLAVFAAMVFFEMNRRFIESAAARNNAAIALRAAELKAQKEQSSAK